MRDKKLLTKILKLATVTVKSIYKQIIVFLAIYLSKKKLVYFDGRNSNLHLTVFDRNANLYTIKDHHAGNVADYWSVKADGVYIPRAQ